LNRVLSVALAESHKFERIEREFSALYNNRLPSGKGDNECDDMKG
jgi:hypothetical protein